MALTGHGTQWHEVDGSDLGGAPYCFILREIPLRPVRFVDPVPDLPSG